MPRPATWRARDRTLDLSARPLVMGVLNVTPDSFSDGGQFLALDDALRHVDVMVEAGADIVDIGGESTRPGAEAVSEAEELDRVVPVIEAVATRLSVTLSVDTYKAPVAAAALAAGAHIVNDIGGLRLDPAMAATVAAAQAGVVLMHMQGEPRTMQRAPRYADLFGEIGAFLIEACGLAEAAGVDRDAIAIDPGIGFGKTGADNWEILARLGELNRLGRPVLIGTSRKSFLRACVGPDRRDMQAATLATSVAACMSGAAIVRVHDVRAHRRAAEAVGQIWRAADRRS